VDLARRAHARSRSADRHGGHYHRVEARSLTRANASELRDRALELAMDKMGRWEAAAAELQGHGYCASDPTEQVAHGMRYLFDCTSRMSLRQVGAKPEVRFHHEKVGKIQEAAQVVLGLARPGGK
jgi:hypothetical protein